MTSKERLYRIYSGKGEIDRHAIKLWGFHPGQELLHQDYKKVYDFAVDRVDIVEEVASPLNIVWGYLEKSQFHTYKNPSSHEGWHEVITEVSTGRRTLRMVSMENDFKHPGFIKEHFVKEPEDLKEILIMPYKSIKFTPDAYINKQNMLGDRGIVHYSLPHAPYTLQYLLGTELMAFWSIDNPGLMLEAIDLFSNRIIEHIKQVFLSGLNPPVFGWVGPELFIPPLLSVDNFLKFDYPFDKKIIELIHENGAYAWIHSHGNMGPVLDHFLTMGLDILNPVEPPPIGQYTLEQIVKIVNGRMVLEGNIEVHDVITLAEEELRNLVRVTVNEGFKNNGRFILCMSAGYMEYPFPTKNHINNIIAFIDEGCNISRELNK